MKPRRSAPKSRSPAVDLPRAEAAIRDLLLALGLDLDRPELDGTPRRVAESWSSRLLEGHRRDPREALGKTFASKGRGAVVAAEIPFISMCPHHLLPLRGVAHL